MKKIFKNWLEILPFIFVFIASLYRPYDADLGWHLKYGEHFFKTGQILKENTFSQEMRDYIWPNISWGYDVFAYGAYYLGGFLGLSILGALVITLTFFFFSKFAKLDYWDKAIIFPFLVFIQDPVNVISLRSQLFGMLLLGIMFYIIKLSEDGDRKKLFLLPPLFLVWVNIHGLYILGLALFFIWSGFKVLIKFIEEGYKIKTVFEDVKFFALITVLILLVTLVNPFGYTIYIDAFAHLNDPMLKSVMEYLPFSELSSLWWNQLTIGILFIFGVLFLAFTDSLKKNLPLLGVITVLYGLSFMVRRYAWNLYYLSLPLLKPISEFFKPESDKTTKKAATVIIVLSVIGALFLKQPFNQYKNMSWDVYCTILTGCSKEGAEFLVKNNLTEEVFTIYNWGGYLIWNYPQIKPPVDGRMHLWRDEKGVSAFEEFYRVEQDLESIENSKYNIAFVSPEKNVYDRLLKLMEQGKWRRVYRDEYSSIFIRIEKK